MLEGKVTAKYTYGKAVAGKLTLRFIQSRQGYGYGVTQDAVKVGAGVVDGGRGVLSGSKLGELQVNRACNAVLQPTEQINSHHQLPVFAAISTFCNHLPVPVLTFQPSALLSSLSRVPCLWHQYPLH